MISEILVWEEIFLPLRLFQFRSEQCVGAEGLWVDHMLTVYDLARFTL